MKLHIRLPKLETYKRDKRKSIEEIYNSFSKLGNNWIGNIIAYQKADSGKNKNILLPIMGFRTKNKGNAIWIIAGIHGEEPAGVNALVKKLSFLNRVGKRIPMVIFPLCNPSGYWRNWRYQNRKKISKSGNTESVGDSDHYLPNLEKPNKAREKKPASKVAGIFSSYVLSLAKKYRPFLVLDLHEDASKRKTYIYSQGRLGANDPIAREIVNILKKRGSRIYERGQTSFNQKIKDGVVSNIHDGSIDELLSSKYIIKGKRRMKGPYARSVIVVETNTVGIPISKRVNIHSKILSKIKKFYNISKSIYDDPYLKKQIESDIV